MTDDLGLGGIALGVLLALALGGGACLHIVSSVRAWERGGWGRRHLVSPASCLAFVYLQQVAISGNFATSPGLGQDLPESFRTWVASVSWAAFAYPFGLFLISDEEWLEYVPPVANIAFYSSVATLAALVLYPLVALTVSKRLLRATVRVPPALSYGAIEEKELDISSEVLSSAHGDSERAQRLSLQTAEYEEGLALIERPRRLNIPRSCFYRPRGLLMLSAIAEAAWTMLGLAFLPLVVESAIYVGDSLRQGEDFSFFWATLSAILLFLGVCTILVLCLLTACGVIRCHSSLDRIPARLFGATAALFFSYLVIATSAGLGNEIYLSNDSSFALIGPYAGYTIGYFLSFSAVLLRRQYHDTRYRFLEAVVFLVVAVRTVCLGCAVGISGTVPSLGNALFALIFGVDALVVAMLLLEPEIVSFKGVDALASLEDAETMDPEDVQLLLDGNVGMLEAVTIKSGIKLIAYEELVLKQKLGHGAGGVVWAATWKEKDVAVKVLFSAQDGMDTEHLADDLSEVKMLTSFEHPKIVDFYGLSIHDGDVCIILELMEYGSLSNVVTSLKHLVTIETRLRLLLDAAEALVYLHENNVLHRDIKPHNLLVNSSWVCKVADFGISTIKTKTKTMTAVGTPIYMAPEVLDHTRYGPPADVYSFGIVIVEVLSMKKPYEELSGISDVALFFKIFHERLRPSFAGVPKELHELLVTALSHEPGSRPTMAELCGGLRKFYATTTSTNSAS